MRNRSPAQQAFMRYKRNRQLLVGKWASGKPMVTGVVADHLRQRIKELEAEYPEVRARYEKFAEFF